jgi:N-acetylmuramoyl-L-alanine amidase CwlA
METKQMYLDVKHPNRPGTLMNKVTGHVVHWTANEGKGSNAVANRNYFNRKWRVIASKIYEIYNNAKGKPVSFRKASAHLNVDDGTLTENIPWKKGKAEMAYHVGAEADEYMSGILKKLGSTYPNNCTIGLEICVNSDGDFKKAYANAVKVSAMVLKEHGLTVDQMYRHYDITGKLCPGFFTDNSYAKKYLSTTKDLAWQAYKDAVAKELAALNAPATPSTPQVWRVFQKEVQKAGFTTADLAIAWADNLYKTTKDATIIVKNPSLAVYYTPSKHPEKF